MSHRAFRLASISLLLAVACDSGNKPATENKPKSAAAIAEPDDSKSPPDRAAEEPPTDAQDPRDPPAEQEPKGGPGPKLPFATEAVVERAAEISNEAKTDWIPNKALEGPDTALAVLHLAQTAEDPRLAGAALKALPSQYWGKDHKERRTVDADYVAVVVRRLSSDDPFVLEGALAAAGMGADVEPPGPTLVAALLGRAKPGQEPEARVLALRALAGVEPLTTEIQDAFLTALDDDDPGMVALTLSTFKQYTSRFTERAPLTAKLQEMTTSDHAGVRAKALAALTTIDRGPAHRESASKRALEMLKDESPLVRGEAVYALGAMRQVEHASKIVDLMEDDAEVKLRIDGWKELDGSSATKNLLAPGGETVTGTALLSLAILSSATDSNFEYAKLIDRKKIGEPNFDAAVEAAKAWLKANEAK